MSRSRKIALWAITILIVGFGAVQLVPYGRDHTNPPVTAEPAWDSLQTLALARLACFDCHSNETRWLWFHNIAPGSWLVYRDVVKGRSRLNFSEWPAAGGGGLMAAAAEKVLEGKMPPLQYKLIHGSARLTDAQRQALADGLRASAR
jgi:hypothetical protein